MRNKGTTHVVTRFAPSPTGVLHVGSARTALFNYLYAKKMGGTFIVRIEDTDKERSKKEHEDDILDGLRWLGLSYDALYRQSERGDIYASSIEKLLSAGSAYESREEKGTVIRFKNKGETVRFHDIIRGDISFDTAELGDFVIARDRRSPLYHLAVVIDDSEMGVTHVIRGEDHISNTPRQILLQNALGSLRPVYAHIPLILSPDRSKLSKRHGAKGIGEYKDEGYLPEALINFMALLGWSPQGEGTGGTQEIFSHDELVERFTLEKIQRSGAIFNIEKLRWINREHIKRLPREVLEERIKEALPDVVRNNTESALLERVIPLIAERIDVFSDVPRMYAEGEFSYFFEKPRYDVSKIPWKMDDPHKTKEHLLESVAILETLPEPGFTAEAVRSAIGDYAEREGKGSVLWPMRYALSGREKSPDPFTIASILGKSESCARLRDAASRL